MSYERWAKRMDDAVESTWLRSLRSQGTDPRKTPRHRFVPTPSGAKQQGRGLRGRTLPAGADR
jgi:hypothetical protein